LRLRIFESLSNTTLKGKFHNEFGMVLKDLGVAEQRQDYVDRALIELQPQAFISNRQSSRATKLVLKTILDSFSG
jgi:hypothetical protein